MDPLYSLLKVFQRSKDKIMKYRRLKVIFFLILSVPNRNYQNSSNKISSKVVPATNNKV